MTTIGHKTKPRDARRRQIRLIQATFAGAAAVATLALFNAAPPGGAGTFVASGSQFQQTAPSMRGDANSGGGRIIAVNDDDNTNPSSGDIFTQNAQDQSTASGAGT
jgi:hypothetical protein